MNKSEEVQLKLGGMTCSSCSGLIENVIGGLDGVSSIEVNLLMETGKYVFFFFFFCFLFFVFCFLFFVFCFLFFVFCFLFFVDMFFLNPFSYFFFLPF